MARKIKRQTRPRGYGQYHIQWCAPNDVWPKGGWSVFRITGDEIASRTIWEGYNHEKGYPTGKVEWRHSWPGYIGMVATLPAVAGLIDEEAREICTFVSYEDEAV
jgi:hypothetical protein